MSGILFAALLLVAPSDNGSTEVVQPPTPVSVPQSGASPAPTSSQGLREQVDQALRRWVNPAPDLRETAARDLLGLYQTVGKSEQLSASLRERLQQRLRNRLVRLADQLERPAAAAAGSSPGVPPAAAQVPGDKAAILAQQGAAAGRVAARRPRAAPGPASGNQAGAAADNAQQLVDLIRNTVAPTTWDVRGGPGTIDYWSPGHAMVILQTEPVQEDVADLLDQLRRAGQ